MKRSLRKILFRSTVNYEELVTIVTEIEGIINCRPLTYIYNDNTEEVVTPSHLIYGRQLLSKPSNDKPNNFHLENLTRRMKYLHTLIQHYWNRWKLEYLNELREYHRCGKEEDTRINVGDIVLVEDPTLKRNYWKLGKITKLIKGHDERVRTATVKIYNNNSIHQLINRPICKLYLLEIRANENTEKDEIIADQAIVDNDLTSSYELNQQPNRLAADTCTLIRRLSGQV